MPILNHYIETAAQLITDYDGAVPLHLFLKQFFSQHKKYGARDRKQISSLCYSYYRIGKALPNSTFSQKVTLALFLCCNEPNSILGMLNAEWNEKVDLPLDEKLQIAQQDELPSSIFPFDNELSAEMSAASLGTNMLTQPDVFIRIRPGKETTVLKKLDELGWIYKREGSNAIRLAASSPVDKHFIMNNEVVIQDLNSQQVGQIVQDIFYKKNFTPASVWDCCAASGGKSIMVHDIYPGIDLTVSDIRQSILHNLDRRFKEAGITKYKSFVADISSFASRTNNFDLILADVPCIGSGTWARTPEQLYFFDKSTIDAFASKQFAIVNNAIKHLKPGGWLVYITCSVFKKENEEVIAKVLQNHSLTLIHSQIIDGTSMLADSMYIAIMQLQNKID